MRRIRLSWFLRGLSEDEAGPLCGLMFDDVADGWCLVESGGDGSRRERSEGRA